MAQQTLTSAVEPGFRPATMLMFVLTLLVAGAAGCGNAAPPRSGRPSGARPASASPDMRDSERAAVSKRTPPDASTREQTETSTVLAANEKSQPPDAQPPTEGNAGDPAASAVPAGSEPVADPQLWPDQDRWPLGRGSPIATGVAASGLPDNPQLLWKFAAPEGAYESTPIIADGVVYIGCLNGFLYALGLADGREKWKYKTELGFYAAPALRDGLLYIGDAEGRFYCLDAASGEPKWTFAAQAEIDSGANFHGDRILFGSQDSHLYCLEADSGELVWKFAIEDQIRCFPTVVGDRSFVAGCDSKFHIIDLRTGKEVAQVDIEAPTGAAPAVAGDLVYFGTEGESVFCINWRQAKVVWKYHDPKRRMPFRSSAALAEGLVLIGGRDKLLHALDARSGSERWAFATRSRVDSSPVVVGRRVFFGSADGSVYALAIDSGKKVWQYEAGGGFSGSPAVAAGRLVIASEDGVVYCFGQK
jgi:outer membrane protein assembly factor BamB